MTFPDPFVHPICVTSAYNRLSQERKKDFLPGGIDEAANIACAYIHILPCYTDYDSLLNLYFTIVSFRHFYLGRQREEVIVKTELQRMIGEENPGKELLDKIFDCTNQIRENFSYCTSKPYHLSREDQIVIRSIHDNVCELYADRSREEREDFGKTRDNPIHVHSPYGAVKYLNLLYTDTMDTGRHVPVLWNKNGTVFSRKYGALIDRYSINYPGEKPFMNLYMSLYAEEGETSTTAPKGFTLISVRN